MKSRKTLALALVGSLLLSSSLAWSQPEDLISGPPRAITGRLSRPIKVLPMVVSIVLATPTGRESRCPSATANLVTW